MLAVNHTDQREEIQELQHRLSEVPNLDIWDLPHAEKCCIPAV